MQRHSVLALGVCGLLAAGLGLGPGDVRAGETTGDEKKVVKRVEVRVGGGAFLGVGLGDVEGDARGAKVESVEADSPAAKAGIKAGDVIVRFDGDSVRSAAQLARLVGETPVGRPVAIDVSRGGATQKLTATLAQGHRRVLLGGGDGGNVEDFEFDVPAPPPPPEAPGAPRPPRTPLPPGAPAPPAMPHVWAWNDEGRDFMFHMFPGRPRKLGIQYQEIGDQLAAYFKLAEKSGVLVTEVEAEGPAGKAGMKAGDVILKFEGKAIKDGGELRDAVGAAEGGQVVSVTVQRDGKPIDLKVTLAKPGAAGHRHSGRTT